MRYIIGIDLGTTNSCVSFVDTQHPKLAVETFGIPQLVAPGFIETLSMLPSFCYLSSPHEWPEGSLDLPWKKDLHIVSGKFAKGQGDRSPTRCIQSAKSWLCHSAAGRKEKILPPTAVEGLDKMSPVSATAVYLQHIKEAWNHLMGKGNPENEFEAQEIILTVPASFDEVARALTAEAAKLAGYNSMTLLEEPQAAFYCWIAANEKKWVEFFKEGDCILVCDVGGGTTDFSLIEVVIQNDRLGFRRLSVGDHLLLGGDNMDATISHYLETKLSIELTPLQHLQLLYQARQAKEYLLSAERKEGESFKCILQGTGSKVIQGSYAIDITQKEIKDLLLEGFFKQYSWNEALAVTKSSAVRSMGLPYEAEPSITKHLATFLSKSSKMQGIIKSPDYVLVNGGTMKPPLFQMAIMESLSTWFPQKKIQILSNPSLDLAVSRGAGYYGKVRRGLGVKIAGGVPRGYYLGLELKNAAGQSTQKAMMLLPKGAEENASYQPKQTFWLSPNKPVAFHLYSSEVRLEDQPGDIVEVSPEEMHLLPPIHTILYYGKKGGDEQSIPVDLHIALSPVGTLDLWLQSQKSPHKWSLEFQVRAASGQEDHLLSIQNARVDETFDREFLERSKGVLDDFFISKIPPKQVMEQLETAIGQTRQKWSPSLLRNMAEALLNKASERNQNLEIRIRWWNLVGYFLRPGFGYPLDDFRIKNLWKVILEDFNKKCSLDEANQIWICYRRIAGGLTKGQQVQLANEILPTIWNKKSNEIELKNKKDHYPYAEKIRTVASFEFLEVPLKIKLGEALLKRLQQHSEACDFWALGRLGARYLLYGSSANVIPREICEQWIKKLLDRPCENRAYYLALAQLSQQSDDRSLNISEKLFKQVADLLNEKSYGNFLDNRNENREMMFGEQLPLGLSLSEELT